MCVCGRGVFSRYCHYLARLTSGRCPAQHLETHLGWVHLVQLPAWLLLANPNSPSKGPTQTMLRVASRASNRAVSQIQPRRFAHGVHYGAAEPVGPYLKWTAAVGGFIALVTYDRFYSDRKISKLLSPSTDNSQEIEQQRQKFADRQIQEQDRNIEFFLPRPRTTHLTTFSPSPVPGGSHREQHSNEVVDTTKLGERRPRV